MYNREDPLKSMGRRLFGPGRFSPFFQRHQTTEVADVNKFCQSKPARAVWLSPLYLVRLGSETPVAQARGCHGSQVCRGHQAEAQGGQLQVGLGELATCGSLPALPWTWVNHPISWSIGGVPCTPRSPRSTRRSTGLGGPRHLHLHGSAPARGRLPEPREVGGWLLEVPISCLERGVVYSPSLCAVLLFLFGRSTLLCVLFFLCFSLFVFLQDGEAIEQQVYATKTTERRRFTRQVKTCGFRGANRDFGGQSVPP